MDLFHFHRVLIVSTVLFASGFGAYAWRRYATLQQTDYLFVAVASIVIVAVMLGYLFYFNTKLKCVRQDRTTPSGT